MPLCNSEKWRLQNAQHLSIISHLHNFQSSAICPSTTGHPGEFLKQQDDVTMRHFAPNILASLAAITLSTTLLYGIL
jgi:hypothetical protein